MKNNSQLVMFFNQGTFYNPSKISVKIVEEIENIGEPIILPINTGAPKEANVPILLFQQNPDIRIVANFDSINITASGEYITKLCDIAEKIFDIFTCECGFHRLGYVPLIVLDKEKISIFKEKFIGENVGKCDDFHLYWKITKEMNGININCWERYFTDVIQIDGLVQTFDFNTLVDEQLLIDKNFIREFYDYCNKYIFTKNF